MIFIFLFFHIEKFNFIKFASHVPLQIVISGNFQLSPDFRQRASSNASSVGRLSPIPSLAIENDWDYALDVDTTDTANGVTAQTNLLLEDLAGTLADELTLQSDLFNGSVFEIIQPPPLNRPSLKV